MDITKRIRACIGPSACAPASALDAALESAGAAPGLPASPCTTIDIVPARIPPSREQGRGWTCGVLSKQPAARFPLTSNRHHSAAEGCPRHCPPSTTFSKSQAIYYVLPTDIVPVDIFGGLVLALCFHSHAYCGCAEYTPAVPAPWDKPRRSHIRCCINTSRPILLGRNRHR